MVLEFHVLVSMPHVFGNNSMQCQGVVYGGSIDGKHDT
jgi:hypothetical protein